MSSALIFLVDFARHFWEITLEAAPWLLLGLLAAGALKAFVSDQLMARWMGKRGLTGVIRAALIGAPLPLCSCGVVPTAIGIRRQGASKGATTSFLISTPETGVDSFAISYALLGPFMAIVRPVAAIFSAILAGMLVDATDNDDPESPSAQADKPEEDSSSCCSTTPSPPSSPPPGTSAQTCCTTAAPKAPRDSLFARLLAGERYALTRLLSDLKLWLMIGLALSALMRTLIPDNALADLGHGPWAMGVMLVVGLPIYVCATASTPVAASMIVAGVSPGAALVFLLAGPATNAGTLAIVKRELGWRALAAYLASVAGVAVAMGLAVDAIVTAWDITVAGAPLHIMAHAPAQWLAILSTGVLLLGAFWPMVTSVRRRTQAQEPKATLPQACQCSSATPPHEVPHSPCH